MLDFSKCLDDLKSRVTDEYDDEKEEYKEELKEKRLRQSGVPKKYWGLTLKDFDISKNENAAKWLKAIQNYIQSVNNNGIYKTLLLYGGNGLGKSFLASMIVRECGGRFYHSYDILERLESAKSFKATESREDIFHEIESYKLIVIDEVGRMASPEEQKALFHLLNDLYENGQSVVLITNLSIKEFCNYLGSAIVDRFKETGFSLEFKGKSYREIIRQNNRK